MPFAMSVLYQILVFVFDLSASAASPPFASMSSSFCPEILASCECELACCPDPERYGKNDKTRAPIGYRLGRGSGGEDAGVGDPGRLVALQHYVVVKLVQNGLDQIFHLRGIRHVLGPHEDLDLEGIGPGIVDVRLG